MLIRVKTIQKMTQRQNVLKINNLSIEDRLILQNINTAFDLEWECPHILNPQDFPSNIPLLSTPPPPSILVEDLASNSGSHIVDLQGF
jgi:hypothetical protein